MELLADVVDEDEDATIRLLRDDGDEVDGGDRDDVDDADDEDGWMTKPTAGVALFDVIPTAAAADIDAGPPLLLLLLLLLLAHGVDSSSLLISIS